MKRSITYLLLCIACHLQAQELDSIKVVQTQQHFYYQGLLQDFHKNPFLYYITPIRNYTKAELAFLQNKKNTKKAQEADKITHLSLKGEGIYRKKNTIFTGSLGYTKNYQNGVGWNLSSFFPYKNEAERSPFYNLTYQKGNWNNQFYNLNGNVLFPILKNKLFAVLSINYNTLQFFRTIQPIPKLTYLDLLGKATLYYKYNANNYFGASIHGGYLNNRIDIDYQGHNENIPANTEIFNRISLGYGVIQTSRLQTLKENDQKIGFGASHIFKNKEHLLRTQFAYTRTKNSHFYFITTSDIDEPIGNYTVDHFSGNFNWFNFKKGTQFSVEGSYTFGENFRVVTQGKNYESTLLKGSITYQVLQQQLAKVVHNYGVRLGMYQLAKKDFQAVNNFTFTNTTVEAFYGKDFSLAGTQKIYIKAKAGMHFNLDKSHLFSQNNRFIREVALPDFQINTATRLNTLLEAGYQQKVKAQTYMNIGLKLMQQYYFNINKNILNNTGTNHTAQLYINLVY